MLEPGAVKVARPVLRGLGVGNGPRLLGEGMVVRPSLYSISKRSYEPILGCKLRLSSVWNLGAIYLPSSLWLEPIFGS